MTSMQTNQPETFARPPKRNALPMDTEDMSHGQREALEVAESARDVEETRQSFASQLFLGEFDPTQIYPFPTQSEEERRIGDGMVSRVSAFLRDNLDPDEVDETRTIPSHVIKGLRELGVFRMKVPKEYGGLGFSQVNYNRVVMAIASYCGSTAVLVSAHQSIGVPKPLAMFGTDEQKQKYFKKINDGALTAFALTEPEVGSDPAKMKTTADLSKDGRYYILNGNKQWTTNGPIADLLVAMARTAPKVRRGRERTQITAFIVESDWPGVIVEHRCDFMGLRGIQNGLIRFDNVKVPVENVLWGEGLGLKLALKTLNTGRLTLPAACTGLGKLCLSIVRRWGKEREQWGKPIGEHQFGQEKLAYIASTTFAMEAVTWLTSHWADEQRDIRIEAAMAKLFCSEASWKMIDMTMQFRGGRGYERATSLRDRGETPYPVERMMRDARINTIIEGTSEIMRLFLAREALDPHLQRSAEMFNKELKMIGRMKLGARLAGYYSWWYVKQLFGARFSRKTTNIGLLRSHHRYIERTAHRLAAALFLAMARYQQKLERKQLLLGRVIDIGTELFAMAATCSYATSNTVSNDTKGTGEELADLFCNQARNRIEEHFRAIKTINDRQLKSISNHVINGHYRWMEDGVIQNQEDPRTEQITPKAA